MRAGFRAIPAPGLHNRRRRQGRASRSGCKAAGGSETMTLGRVAICARGRSGPVSASPVGPLPNPPEPLMHRRLAVVLAMLFVLLACVSAEASGRRRWRGASSPASTGTPQNQAPYLPGASPYVTDHGTRPKYYVPPTVPRTPTWKMYGTQPGVTPGDWPSYAPLGFGGYRFPAVGNQAYR